MRLFIPSIVLCMPDFINIFIFLDDSLKVKLIWSELPLKTLHWIWPCEVWKIPRRGLFTFFAQSKRWHNSILTHQFRHTRVFQLHQPMANGVLKGFDVTPVSWRFSKKISRRHVLADFFVEILTNMATIWVFKPHSVSFQYLMGSFRLETCFRVIVHWLFTHFTDKTAHKSYWNPPFFLYVEICFKFPSK